MRDAESTVKRFLRKTLERDMGHDSSKSWTQQKPVFRWSVLGPFPAPRDEILGLFLVSKYSVTRFPISDSAAGTLNAPAFSMFVVSWCNVPILPQLTSKTSR